MSETTILNIATLICQLIILVFLIKAERERGPSASQTSIQVPLNVDSKAFAEAVIRPADEANCDSPQAERNQR